MAKSRSNRVTRFAAFIGSASLLCSIALAGAAKSQQAAQDQEEIWATWIGSKYATTLNYPQSRFTLLPEPDAHDGRTFVSRDGARIAAFAYFNDGQTIESIDASLQDGSDHGHIILRRRGANSTVTSGSRVIDGQEQVFYVKYFLEPGGQVVHAVVITYPVATKGIYGRLISRIVAPLETSKYEPMRPVQGGAPVAGPGADTQAHRPTQPGYEPLKVPADPVIVRNDVDGAVTAGATQPTTFELNAPVLVTQIMTYHYGAQTQPDVIGLQHEDGTIYGPWQAAGAVGSGNIRNAYWWVRPDITLKPGRYTVIDSDPTTWSHEAATRGAGVVQIWGALHERAFPQQQAQHDRQNSRRRPRLFDRWKSHRRAGLDQVGTARGTRLSRLAV